MDRAKDVLKKCGQKAAEAARKTEDLAGNTWQHRPSIAEVAFGRIARGTTVLAEGGEEKIFQRTFETIPEERLSKSYPCYLSTSTGPVMGVIYLSTAKLAFCSDDPIACQAGENTVYSLYKVVIQRHQLKRVDSSTSTVKPAEKYIQVISVDNHEFWFMGFIHYESAVKNLQEAVPPPAPASLSSYLQSNNIEF